MILQYVKNNICEIPILYHCLNVAFSVAEDFKNRICVPCWYDCREIFHSDYPNPNHIFINHKKNSSVKIEKFIASLEETLNIKNKSKIFKTSRKTATLIILATFWKKQLRFSLLTLLLRAAAQNKLIAFNYDIFQYCKYLKDTKNAIKLFFSGFTKYEGENNSWHQNFKRLNIEKCKNLLRQ